MKNILSILILSITLLSCDKILGDSPNKVFNVIGLNSNKIPSSFERHFKEIKLLAEDQNLKIPKGEAKDFKMVPAKNYQEYMEYHYSKTFEGDIKAIENLKDNEEVAPIKKLALEMFRYADEIYKKDFMQLAKKLDNGASWEEIDSLVIKLDNTKGIELDKKREKLMNLIIPYADKHGVEYKMMDTPF